MFAFIISFFNIQVVVHGCCVHKYLRVCICVSGIPKTGVDDDDDEGGSSRPRKRCKVILVVLLTYGIGMMSQHVCNTVKPVTKDHGD